MLIELSVLGEKHLGRCWIPQLPAAVVHGILIVAAMPKESPKTIVTLSKGI